MATSVISVATMGPVQPVFLLICGAPLPEPQSKSIRDVPPTQNHSQTKATSP